MSKRRYIRNRRDRDTYYNNFYSEPDHSRNDSRYNNFFTVDWDHHRRITSDNIFLESLPSETYLIKTRHLVTKTAHKQTTKARHQPTEFREKRAFECERKQKRRQKFMRRMVFKNINSGKSINQNKRKQRSCK